MENLYEYMTKRMKPMKGQTGNFMEITDGDLRAVIKYFDEPSEENGIDGGRISKIEIRDTKRGTVEVNYDRGWDVRPEDVKKHPGYDDEKPNPKLKKFYERIIKEFN